MSNPKSPKPTLDKAALDAADDDDLDDLDDVLDQFSNTRPPAPPPTATTLGVKGSGLGSGFGAGRPRTNTRVDAPPSSTPGKGPPLGATAETIDEDLLSSEFAQELAKGMENLMRELGAEAGAPPPDSSAPLGSGVSEEQTREFKAAWEAMLIEGMNGNVGGGGGGEDPLLSLGDVLQPKPGASQSTSGQTLAEATNFQAQIKQAMDKLKEAEGTSKSAESAGGASGDPESMEDLLKSLRDLGLGDLGLDGEGGEGEENEAELAGFLESMMGQLMSKDILYEPLKELSDGFPGYLANPPKPLSPEDRARYNNQLKCVKRILAVFDDPSYSDTNAQSNKLVVDLMSEMQSFGSPPPEIMGPLPPGFDGTSGIPGLNPNDNCTIC